MVINHKKIRRIMRKYGLVVKIRCAHPYKQMLNTTKEHKKLKTYLSVKSIKTNHSPHSYIYSTLQ
ncbi:transposase [Paenibacillus sp. S3N08]|uniref:Transposase n=1 Tax=Paenibacillus agricola TaxID=2716264 RepID=A0ABX0JD09_9BACL|nr:transposase [Paenibacillus agricola]